MTAFKTAVFLAAIALSLFVLDYAILKDTRDRQLAFQPVITPSAPAVATQVAETAKSSTTADLPKAGDSMTIAFTDDRVMIAVVDRTVVRSAKGSPNFVAASILLGYNPAVLPSGDPVKARVLSVVVDCAGGQYVVLAKYLLGAYGALLSEDQSAKGHGYEKIKPNTAIDKVSELLCKPNSTPAPLAHHDGRTTI